MGHLLLALEMLTQQGCLSHAGARLAAAKQVLPWVMSPYQHLHQHVAHDQLMHLADLIQEPVLVFLATCCTLRHVPSQHRVIGHGLHDHWQA